jgi:hypothetical protein
VRSVNGPEVTVIQGYQVPGAINGDGAIRCVYLTNGAVLSGFTLTNGATLSFSGDLDREEAGGGVWCEFGNPLVTNCTLTGNSANFDGGGAYSGTLNNCTLTGNSAARGGGTSSCTLNSCLLTNNSSVLFGGGGAYKGVLNNCTLTGNWVVGSVEGGGAWYCTLNNCMLTGNSAGYGGGAGSCTLNNCTLTGNWASWDGGGANASTLNNCILYYNDCDLNFDAPSGTSNYMGSTFNYCCTTPLPDSGVGNITAEPLFVDGLNGDLRLQSNSPCINAGANAYVLGATDLDGNPRIRGGTVDIGAYELQNPASVISYAWLQRYCLPTDGTADWLDTDNDGMNNYQEWLAGTDPTDATSVLRLQAPVVNAPGLSLRWSSDTNHAYFVQRATGLKTPLSFSLVRSNISGLAGATAYTDTTACASKGAAFYRIGTSTTSGPAPALLQQPAFVPASMTLTWPSVATRTYFVQRATNRVNQPAFSLLQSGIPGLPGTTSFTDTNPPASGPAFYRVGVQP